MTPWTVALQAHLSMGILQARILEWLSCSPGDLPNPGMELRSPALQAGSLPSEPPEEAPILWPPDAKSRLIGKDPDAGKD